MVADGASSGRRGGGRQRATLWLPRARRRRAAATSDLPARRRRVATIASGGTAALLAAAGGAAWYYAERITESPGLRPVPPLPADGVQIRSVGEHEVVLAGPAAPRPGWWGLTTESGWLRIGPPAGEVALDPTVAELSDVTVGVRRPIEHRVGRVAAGATGRLDAEAIPVDPTDIGLETFGLVVPGPVGDLPAWWFPAPGTGRGGTAAILVHGRSGSRREVTRWVPAFLAAGVSCLAVSYRNAPGAPRSPDGRSHLGATEWADVAAAIELVLGTYGARDVVLFGASMGGACIAELLARSGLAAHVRAVVLDAPVRHWGPVLRAAAQQRGLHPAVLPLLLPPTMALAGVRGRIDWQGLDHLDDPRRYALPTLLFHGAADAVVPVALSDAFAAARQDVVTYHRVPGAGHLHTWNVDRQGCERTLASFLARVLREPPPPPLRLVRDGRPRR